MPQHLFWGMARAAIDDAGMKCVSAAEGLSGSIRVKLFEDSAAYRLSSKASVIVAYVGEEVRGERLLFETVTGAFGRKFKEGGGKFKNCYLLTRID